MDSLSPTTTAQEDIVTAGQRKVNLIWEYTQSGIAISVVLTCMTIFILQAISSTKLEFPTALSNMAFAVLAFYLARTNHQAIGGIGVKATDNQPYQGR